MFKGNLLEVKLIIAETSERISATGEVQRGESPFGMGEKWGFTTPLHFSPHTKNVKMYFGQKKQKHQHENHVFEKGLRHLLSIC